MMRNPYGERAMFGQRRKAILDSIISRLEALETTPAPPPPPIPTEAIVAEIEARIAPELEALALKQIDVERRLKDTNVAVSEGIERTERTERRIASTVARARKELRESGYDHPGVEAEDHELRKVDGDGSHGTEVLNLPGEVEADPNAPSSIRGVPASYLRRARGFQ